MPGPVTPTAASQVDHPRHGHAVRGDLANLDTLRTFAVLSVLFDHVMLTINSLYIHSSAFEQFVMRLGRLGVIAFFVHTSLVLMFSLERVHREFARPVLAFYLRRAFRIYPLSILVVILVSILHVPDLPFGSSRPGLYSMLNVVSNLLLTHNFVGLSVTGPLWSLPFEVQMYAVLPALFLLARRPRSTRTLVALIAIFCAVGIICFESTGKMHFLAYIPCFLSGIVAYSVCRRQRPVLPATLWNVLIPVLMLTAAFVGWRWSHLQLYCGWALSFCLGSGVYLFHDSTGRIWNAITKTVAKYSYGLYLLHTPSLWLVFKVLGIAGPIAGPAVGLSLAFALSVLLFHTVEDPMIRYGKQVAGRLGGVLKARVSVAA